MASEHTGKDSLTGALPRAALHARLAEEMARCQDGNGSLALAVFDIDHFKSINDAFGHQRGDQILVDCVHRLEGLLRTSDQLFRYGGDEFVLLMPHTTREKALSAAGRLIQSVRATPFSGDPPVSTTISMGIATYPADGQTAEELFSRADARLYVVKRTGRGRAVADDSLVPTDLGFTDPSRLIERDGALASFLAFLGDLPGDRGAFAVAGPRASGRSRFLAEAATIARLRGLPVVALHASPALKARSFGALVEALGATPDTRDEGELFQALQGLSGGTGLVFTVDNLTELDPASLALIGRLFRSNDLAAAALIYSVEPEQADLALPVDASLRQMVHLAPLTPAGLRVWLRSAMQDEPAPAFVSWLHQQTRGLPGRVEPALTALKEQGALHHEQGRWVVSPTYVDVVIEGLGEAQALPSALPSFVGREREITEVKRRLEVHRLVTLLGPGGAGKTRLALQVASELIPRYRHGVRVVQLAPVLSADALPAALVEALGLSLGDRIAPRQKLQQYLQHKQLLLVLDNFEHLIEGAELITQLLESAPHLSVLVTSRERLHLPEEALFEVGGLPVPDGGPDDRTAAVQLFLERALPLTGGTELPPGEMAGVVRICQLVEGMPLAIELAAAWVRLLSCAEIAAGIAESLDFLAAQQAEPAARHQSLRAVFEHSWVRLSPEERQVYSRLSVFRGGFDLKAATQVAGASPFMLSALLDKSLLRRTPGGRFEVHELLRQFAAEALGPEAGDVGRRHAAYFLALAEQEAVAIEGLDPRTASDRLAAELPNLRAALQWALDQGDGVLAMQLAGSLRRFWAMVGNETEGRRWTAAALAAPRAEERTAVRARALAGAEHMARRQGDVAEAKRYLDECLALWQELGDTVGVAEALEGLGMVALFGGDPATARRHLEESIAMLRSVGAAGSLHRSLNTLGQVAQIEGKFDECTALWEESLGIARQIGHTHAMASSLNNLAVVCTSRGEYGRAVTFLKECLPLAEQLGIRQLMTAVVGNLGVIAMIQGDHAEAAARLQETLVLARQIESNLFISTAIGDLGLLARRQGDLALAAARHAENLAVGRSAGFVRAAPYYLIGMAAVLTTSGQAEAAARVLGAAEAYLESTRTAPDLVYRQEMEYVIQTLQAELGEEALASRRAEGRAMELDQALAYAGA